MMAGQVEFNNSVNEQIAQKLIEFWHDRPAAQGAYQVADALTPLFVELLNESLQVALDGRRPRSSSSSVHVGHAPDCAVVGSDLAVVACDCGALERPIGAWWTLPSFTYRFNATPPGGSVVEQVPVTVSASTLDAAKSRALAACGDGWSLVLLSVREGE